MSTELGRAAEQAAIDYLIKEKWELVDRNWRNRWCEIDIIMKTSQRAHFKRTQVLHFVEVKYRSNLLFGSGLEYITSKKLKQMQLAAENWLVENSWSEPWQIDVMAVNGQAGDYNFQLIQNVTI